MVDKARLLGWEKQAKTAVERSDWPLAEDRLRRLLEVAPEAWSFWRLYAQVLRELGREEEAERALVRAVKRCEALGEAQGPGPGAPPRAGVEEARELLLELADLRLAAGRPAEAARALRRVLEREPNQWEALYLMGNAFMDAGAFVEAAAAYRQSLATHPFEAETWWNFALALEKVGDREGAAAAYQAWLDQDRVSSEELRAEAEAEIRRLRAGVPG